MGSPILTEKSNALENLIDLKGRFGSDLDRKVQRVGESEWSERAFWLPILPEKSNALGNLINLKGRLSLRS